MIGFEDKMRQGGAAALEEVGKFFMRNDPVHLALRKIARRLGELNIPYAIAGGMALVAHGYDRTTVDVDILVTAEGLGEAQRQLSGLGYLPPFEGSRQLRDTETQVRIEFLVTGTYPGDGKPKPVAFPDPSECSEPRDGISYLRLDKLIELKLASGMTNAGRLKDLADVQELIRVLRLKADFASKLHPYVQAKYLELWRGLQEDAAGGPPSV